MTPYIWLAIMLFCLVTEAITPQLTTIWFAAGALIALLVSLVAPTLLWLHIVLFLSVSVVLLLFTRPLAHKFLNAKKVPTNADRVLGQEALVTEEINNLLETGLVSVKGACWSARSADGLPIAKNEIVIVRAIEGVKLIVEEQDSSN
ncbi:MAG: NfeD family protein [Clostridia bacterium]|nr:NfeD family protein [Clostridia bacterium]